jgi:hypothetical protein
MKKKTCSSRYQSNEKSLVYNKRVNRNKLSEASRDTQKKKMIDFRKVVGKTLLKK